MARSKSERRKRCRNAGKEIEPSWALALPTPPPMLTSVLGGLQPGGIEKEPALRRYSHRSEAGLWPKLAKKPRMTTHLPSPNPTPTRAPSRKGFRRMPVPESGPQTGTAGAVRGAESSQEAARYHRRGTGGSLLLPTFFSKAETVLEPRKESSGSSDLERARCYHSRFSCLPTHPTPP